MTKYVIDTSTLMEELDGVRFNEVILNTLVLRELEKHKSDSRFPDKQKSARDALHMIEENQSVIEFDFNQYPKFQFLDEGYDQDYTDNRLLESLFHHQANGKEIGLLSEDLSLRLQAASFGFPVKTASTPSLATYQGSIAISVEDYRVPYFYNMIESKRSEHDNIFELHLGEYVLLRNNADGENENIVGVWRWNGAIYERITMNQHFQSSIFGEVKPKNFRQAIAMHSLKYDRLTVLTGKAGSGKTYMSFAYIMEQIENGRSVYIVTNNVPLRGTKTFGLKKGDVLEKILQSNLGGILKTKIGIIRTKELIDSGLLNLVAIEDIRGCSFDCILYVTEVQNYTSDMIKTLLERMEIGGKVIFDGDERQIDNPFAKGKNNGINRMFEVFVGSGYLGHVEFIENLRKGISALAEKM